MNINNDQLWVKLIKKVRAWARLNSIWAVHFNSGSCNGCDIEILATLIDHYESQHEPIEPPDPIDALIYHMESRGLTRRDLEPLLGSRARVAEVLNRRRPLTIEMIRRLHEGLGISADVLIRHYPLRGSAA